MKGRSFGLLANLTFGVLGALIGGYLFEFFYHRQQWGDWVIDHCNGRRDTGPGHRRADQQSLKTVLAMQKQSIKTMIRR